MCHGGLTLDFIISFDRHEMRLSEVVYSNVDEM